MTLCRYEKKEIAVDRLSWNHVYTYNIIQEGIGHAEREVTVS